MRAAYITQTGPAASIIVGELPTPEPQGTEIRVRVHVASVNPIDTYIRGGNVAMPLTFPFVPGADLAGIVETVGPLATRFKAGDRVWGSNQGLLGRQGTSAEYVVADEQWLYKTPDAVTDEQAAAIALPGITAHLGLVRDAKLQPGEVFFINGGTGGVGSVAIQIAKQLGAYVITTVGSDEKAALARMLGADVVINYKTMNVDEEIKKAAPAGINVFWETQLMPDFDRAVPLMAERGRFVIIAGRNSRPVMPLGPFYVKGCSLHGFVMFKATPAEQRACAEDLNRWMANGKLQPLIGKTFPLAELAAAHQLQEDNTLQKQGTLLGKILVKVA
jgi:NADPH2:quinone reductase